jgi:hypothetical protein
MTGQTTNLSKDRVLFTCNQNVVAPGLEPQAEEHLIA